MPNVEVYKQTQAGLVIDPTPVGAGATVLDVPCHDEDGTDIRKSSTHIDVVYIRNGFAGFRYWGAHTPYPDIIRERPNVMCSNDGVAWRVPPGITNPIETTAIVQGVLGGDAWCADTDMLYINGRLFCYYMRLDSDPSYSMVRREIIPAPNGQVRLGDVEVCWPLTAAQARVSPALVSEGGANVSCWYVNSADNSVNLVTSTDGGLTFGSPSACTIQKDDSGLPRPWHLDVVKQDGVYHMLLMDGTIGENALYHLTSRDKLVWTLTNIGCPSIPRYGDNLFDGAGHYRSSLVPKEGGLFDVYVSGQPHGRATDAASHYPTMDVTANSGADTLACVTHPHYLDVGDDFQLVGGTPPTPMALNTTYYVAARPDNLTIQPSATKGGSVINLSDNGSAIKMSRRPWRFILYRNVTLPMPASVVLPRRAIGGTGMYGGAVLMPVVCPIAAQAAWPAVNTGLATRLVVERPTEVRYFCFVVGVQNGNIEVGILRGVGDNGLNVFPVKTSTVIACPAVGFQKIDLGIMTLLPGTYWLWMWSSGTTFQAPHTQASFPTYLSGIIAGLAPVGGRALVAAGNTLDPVNTGRFVQMWLQGNF